MTWTDILVHPPGHLKWVWGLLLISLILRALPRLLGRLAAAFEECAHCQKPLLKGQGTCYHCLRALPPRAALARERRLGDIARHR